MTGKDSEKKLIFDDVEYSLDDMSEQAKAQLINISFVDEELQRLNNELAVADTARIGYINALKRETSQKNSTED